MAVQTPFWQQVDEGEDEDEQVHYLRAFGSALPFRSATLQYALARRFHGSQEVSVVMSSVTGRREAPLIAQKGARGSHRFLV